MPQAVVKFKAHLSLSAKDDSGAVEGSGGSNPSGMTCIVEALLDLKISERSYNSSLPGKRQDSPAPDPAKHIPKVSSVPSSPPITPPRTFHRRASLSLSNERQLSMHSPVPGAWPTSPPPTSPLQSPVTPCRPTNSLRTDSLYFTPPQSPTSAPIPLPGGTVNQHTPMARAVSDSPTSAISGIQCARLTKKGPRCKNEMAKDPALSFLLVTPDGSPEWFCHLHRVSQPLLGPSTGFHPHACSPEVWVRYSDWIPDYLSKQTRDALQEEMRKSVSTADEDGYVYAFEIRQPGSNKFTIKVGRSTQVVRRLNEWGKQCRSGEFILRGWWPGNIEDDANYQKRVMDLVDRRVGPGLKGKYCHRLEKLIHLELADIALNSLHLARESTGEPSNGQGSPRPNRLSPIRKRARQPCLSCNQVHQETFSLERMHSGGEWERVIKPVIEKWGRFVTEYAHK